MYHKLQYISQGTIVSQQLANIQAALDAGCQWVQLRFKHAHEQDVRRLGEAVKNLCASYAATFILNDHPPLAKEVDADGVHLGLQDMQVKDARNILGADKIIGGTANTFHDVCQRVEEGCNYIGLGPFRFTTTKEKLSPVLGLKGYESINAAIQRNGFTVPVYAIGGIVLEDIPSLIEAGVHGVALSNYITHHQDKKLLIGQLNSLIYEKINHC